jgi:hypothetical protein
MNKGDEATETSSRDKEKEEATDVAVGRCSFSLR